MSDLGQRERRFGESLGRFRRDEVPAQLVGNPPEDFDEHSVLRWFERREVRLRLQHLKPRGDPFGRQSGAVNRNFVDRAMKTVAGVQCERRADPKFVVIDDRSLGGRSAEVPLAVQRFAVDVAANRLRLAERVAGRDV